MKSWQNWNVHCKHNGLEIIIAFEDKTLDNKHPSPLWGNWSQFEILVKWETVSTIRQRREFDKVHILREKSGDQTIVVRDSGSSGWLVCDVFIHLQDADTMSLSNDRDEKMTKMSMSIICWSTTKQTNSQNVFFKWSQKQFAKPWEEQVRSHGFRVLNEW